MKLTLDVENTVTHRDGKLHLDPFESDNRLVMVGCLTDRGEEYLFRDNFDGVQELLDQATILIGHNIVHDLLWLWECGLKYDGPVFDTMLVEYVLQRGNKQPLSLEACANRYDLETKKQDTMKEYRFVTVYHWGLSLSLNKPWFLKKLKKNVNGIWDASNGGIDHIAETIGIIW